MVTWTETFYPLKVFHKRCAYEFFRNTSKYSRAKISGQNIRIGIDSDAQESKNYGTVINYYIIILIFY